MEWWQALLLGIVQGLTEFLPVSSSGHLMIAKELLGVDCEGFLDFTVAVHFATVMSTIVVFWGVIWKLVKGVFAFKMNDETDYFLKLCLSMIPVAIVGFCFKDQVESLFAENLVTVAVFLLVTAALLLLSDYLTKVIKYKNEYRNGISWWQALVVGIAQACAVVPGLSRSGTTIATGLVSGVRRQDMAQFSFLMVLAPIIGEQLLDVMDILTGEVAVSSGIGASALIIGALAAFVSGLAACKAMVALVRRSKMKWFALYCAVVAVAIFIFA